MKSLGYEYPHDVFFKETIEDVLFIQKKYTNYLFNSWNFYI